MLLVFTSCNDDLLVEQPTDRLSPTNFFRNASDAEVALNAIYAGQQRIQGYSGGDAGVANVWGMHGTDDIVVPPWTNPPDRRLIALFQLDPTINAFYTIYQRHYQEIARANTILNQISLMTEDKIDPEEKARILAEGRTIRASFYFNLVRIYGNVPLETEERTDFTNLDFTQADPAAIYEFITSELEFAVSVLEPGMNTGRITQGAAQALLGNVYLQMAGEPLNQNDKYALAADQYESVMGMGYNLLDDFESVFSYQNELNDEGIYIVEHDGPGQSLDNTATSNLGSFMGPGGQLPDGAGWGTAWANSELEMEFDRDDIRRRVSFAYHNAPNVQDSTRGPNQFLPWKWQKPQVANGQSWANDTPFDYVYIRLAGVLLGYAEAEIRSGGDIEAAVAAANRVRARARGEASADEFLPDLTADMGTEALIDAILKERQKELLYEGHRKGDLIRTGRLIPLMSDFDCSFSAVCPGRPDPKPHHIYWPIPQRVLDLNESMTQNPGYEN
ncbi:RagB/SusD family nutrient uptake outer membrane protein [Neolewinella aurantiaca]|nr:RagB/SusD family nutrient uptake outer membrane protein [Neolewinella aurantiaca]